MDPVPAKGTIPSKLSSFQPRESQGIGSFVRRQVHAYLMTHKKDDVAPQDMYHHVIQDVERALIQEVLAFAKGNQSKAASLLGLHRNTLRQKMRDLLGKRAA